MEEQVADDFFVALALSVLGRVARDGAGAPDARIGELGESIGKRVADDFYSKHALCRAVPPAELGKWVGVFVREYLGPHAAVDGPSIRVSAALRKYAGNHASVLLCAVLRSVFVPVNDAFCCAVEGERIVYSLKP